jgi:hypothetical protein
MFVRSILQRPIASRLPIEYQGCKTAVKKQQERHTNFLGKFNEKVSEVTLFTVLYYHLTGWRVIIGGTAGQVMCLNDLPPMEPRLECFCAYNSSLFHQRQATRLSQTRHLSHTQSSGHSPPNQQTPSRRHLFLSLDLDFSLRASLSLSLSFCER